MSRPDPRPRSCPRLRRRRRRALPGRGLAAFALGWLAPLSAPAALQGLDPGPPVPVEFSHQPDQNGNGGLDPGQVLYSDVPPDSPFDVFPLDVLDIDPSIESGNEPDAQIDALSHGHDALFDLLLQNRVRLLFSTAADGFGPEVAAWGETPGGSVSPHWTHRDLDASEQANPNLLDDIDALEVWGPTQAQDDARYYSIPGDTASSVSVLRWDPGSGAGVPFVTHATIVAAVQALGYTGSANDVDLDALLVRDVIPIGTFTTGDAIVFSIRETPGADFDGGEIVLLEWGQPAVFLSHGGHVWDRAFSVSDAIERPMSNDEVDALEIAFDATLPFEAELTFEYLPGLQPASIQGTGVAVVTPSGTGALETLALFGGVAGSVSLTVWDPGATGSVILTGVGLTAILGSGTFAPLDAPPLTRRTLPVQGNGQLRFCIVGPPCLATTTSLPFTAAGFGLGLGGIVSKGPQFGFLHAPWTLGSATVSYTRSNGNQLLTAMRHGFVHGPLSGTSSVGLPSGVVQLVTPTAVGLASSVVELDHALFTTLRVQFTPEPGFALLFGSGTAALAFLARRRRARPMASSRAPRP